MNSWSGSGNVTKDAELSFLKGSGTAVLKYTIAVQKNTNRKESQFIPIVTFGKQAESLSAYMLKGTGVEIVGELQVNGVKQDDGSYKTYVSVVTSFVNLKGGKKKESDTFGASSKEHDPFESNKDFGEDMTPVDDGDMPF